MRYLVKKILFLLDLIFIKRFNINARARPVGAGELRMCCGDLFGAVSSVQFDIYFTDFTQGSTPLRQRLDVSLNCLRRGSRWLAFFDPAGKINFRLNHLFSRKLLLAQSIFVAQISLNTFYCSVFSSSTSENGYAV